MSDPIRKDETSTIATPDHGDRSAEDPLLQAATSKKGDQRKRAPGGASLYDDALSERTTQRNWKLLIWPVIFGLVIIGMVFSFMSQPSDLERAGHVGNEKPESELAKVVESVHSQELESGETTDQSTGEPAAEPGMTDSASGRAAEDPEMTSPPQQKASVSKNSVPAKVKPEAPKAPPVTTERDASATPRLDSVTEDKEPSRGAAARATGQDLSPTIDSNDAPETEAAALEPEPDPGPSPEVQEAFDRLLRESEVAGKLAWGEYTTLEFVDWRVVQQTEREIWLDLTGKWSGNDQEVHFIWSISIQDGRVRALSQEARNLEASARSQ